MTGELGEFRDDVDEIPDEVRIYRRVDWDKVGGKQHAAQGIPPSLNSNCFKDQTKVALELGYPGPCMSVGVAAILEREGFGPERMLEGLDDYGLAYVTAGELRELVRSTGKPCPQGIMLAPTTAEPWHGVVWDKVERPRKDAVSKAIARKADWLIPLVKM